MTPELNTALKTFKTCADPLRHHASCRPDAQASVFEGRATSYSQLQTRSNRIANALVASGVARQERVAILAKNSDLFFELNFGCWKVDVVLVPVNFRLAPPEMAGIIRDAHASMLFVDDAFAPMAEQLREELPDVREVISLGQNATEWQPFASWYGEHPDVDPEMDIQPSNTCMQLYSSGTTGLPKGTELTHEGVLTLLEVALSDWGDWTDQEVIMVAMPLFHIAGCEMGYLGYAAGGLNVIMPEVDPGQILQDIEAYGVTQTLFVPAVILFLLQHPRCASTNFSSVKAVYYGASPIPLPVLQQAVDTMGCGFAQLYGLTETTGAITYLPPEAHDGTERMKSCGKPIRSVEMRTIRPDGSDCDAGEVGEIICRSKQNMKGYWGQPETTAGAIVDGWFHSGDAGYFDAQGYLYVHDRIKDMIISGGENIYPAEAESALAAHPAIADVAVIGIPDERWGEQVKAIVVLKPGANLTIEGLDEYARQRLAGFKVPRSLDFLDELPRNPSGKILKRVLRQKYWSDEGRLVN
jgi:long-chain acyl-CoA synthetase